MLMCVPAQEIGLLNAAYDGDVESLIYFLEREVPVDSVSPVRNDYLFPIPPSPVNILETFQPGGLYVLSSENERMLVSSV